MEHEENKQKIGGPNKIVQFDQLKFGKCKYNRRRHIEGNWVICMIDHDSDDLRLEVCPDNNRWVENLMPLIEKHVQKGSIIHTDFWQAYNSLPDFGYTHERVKGDPENQLVAPDGTHTPQISSRWRGLKKVFHKGNYAECLIEYSWRRRIKRNHLDAFEELLKAVIYVYKLT